ncbi:MAG: hypothetical protein AAGF95_33370 [Chloroflexota bacterium]
MEEQMSPEKTAFLTFVRTGEFGVIQPEMDVDTVNALLPGCDYRVDPPCIFLIGSNIEITFEHDRMTQGRVRFTPCEIDPWTLELAPWFVWLGTTAMDRIEQLLQYEKVGYRRLLLTDDAYVIEFAHVPIRLLYDEKQQIDKVFRLYDELHPLRSHLLVDVKTFTPEDAEGNQET